MEHRSSKRRCFVIMPFRRKLDRVYTLIQDTASALGLDCSRGDEGRAGFVLKLIRDRIERADVVIADLTGRNANVFYETAMAHMLKDPQQVVLIAQSDEDVPVDLLALRYLRYRADETGLSRLAEDLAEFMKQALAASPGENFESIEGRMERTRRLVAEYNAFLAADESTLASLIIRSRAGLSSLAIDERELVGATGAERLYRKLLLDERDLLMELIRKGATFKAILTPPTAKMWERTDLGWRYERMISFLQQAGSDAKKDDHFPAERYQIALCPLLTNNMVIVGDQVLYEGAKGSLQGGYDLTTRITHTGIIGSHVRAFDGLYEDAKADTLWRHGGKSGRETARGLRKAVVTGLENSRRIYVENEAKWNQHLGVTDRRSRSAGESLRDT